MVHGLGGGEPSRRAKATPKCSFVGLGPPPSAASIGDEDTVGVQDGRHQRRPVGLHVGRHFDLVLSTINQGMMGRVPKDDGSVVWGQPGQPSQAAGQGRKDGCQPPPFSLLPLPGFNMEEKRKWRGEGRVLFLSTPLLLLHTSFQIRVAGRVAEGVPSSAERSWARPGLIFGQTSCLCRLLRSIAKVVFTKECPTHSCAGHWCPVFVRVPVICVPQ